jgi:3-oxoacyl-[acyl-carrier protein] reductase
MKLQGKAAVVTGAGRGIGREVALMLASQGALVLVNDPGVGRNGEATEERPADDVVREIEAAGGRAIADFGSVNRYDDAASMISNCVAQFGTIDILVNVAGVLRERMIWNMTEAEFDAVIDVHLKGHWNMAHHAIRHMRKAGYGRIVNFSSDAFKGAVGQCNYAAAKAGIIALTRSIAKECARFGITANAICPIADTRMTMTPAVAENRRKKFEAGLMTAEQYERISRSRGPEHIAPLAAYLCTEESYPINGQVFHSERGFINTYYFGEDQRFLISPDGSPFTVDQLAENLPGTLLSGLPPVVAPVLPAEAVKAGDETRPRVSA